MSKFYGVYLAYSKYEVLSEEDCSNPNIPDYPSNIAIVRVYDNCQSQLDCYANTMCPASQLFEADTKQEIDEKVKEFQIKFQTKEWLEENIEPFI
jgi:hypothetical protein